jgi:anionic cell wall polymer biosynthesis LytR-Cps2A-Psr (LCP) family protein
MVAVVVVTATFLYLQLRTDEVAEAVRAGETLRSLLVIEDEEGGAAHIYVYIHDTGTHRGALIDIPRNLGSIIDSLQRVDRVDVLYESGGTDALRERVATLIDRPIPYHLSFSTESIKNTIDLLGGMELFIVESFEQHAGEEAVLLPAGNVVLHGQKAMTYLNYEVDGESELERVGRRQKFMEAFLGTLAGRNDFLLHEEVFRHFRNYLDTNLEERALRSYVTELANLDSGRLVHRRVQGTTRVVETESGREPLLFPHFEGQWLKETVRQVEQSIASDNALRDEDVRVSLEILNGTTTSGLARRTKELFEGYGFDVVSFGNAESNQIRNTVLIDRRGRPEQAERVAEIIRAERVVTDVAPAESEADVTIVLGRDFDGTFVRESSED